MPSNGERIERMIQFSSTGLRCLPSPDVMDIRYRSDSQGIESR